MQPDIAHHAALDERLVKAVRGIRLLSLASWPADAQTRFLAGVARGQPALPAIEYPRLDFGDARRELAAIAAAADPAHPLGCYLRDSVHSWDIAAQLLESLGTPTVTTHSVALFGTPEECLPGDGPTTREAAGHFIAIANDLDHELLAPEEHVPVSATALQLQLQADLDEFFDGRVITVELDPTLIAKAAAGATRIRLRHGAAFSDYDRQQLLQHEALVHSLTALNGREQTVLPSLALASPRVTATQEGLATFAEQITGSIDIERMKRISLRILGIDMAIRGADFIEVFRHFVDQGASEHDAYKITQRVFRGGMVEGGACFTKDLSYVKGYVETVNFIRSAVLEGVPEILPMLFVGKVTLDDIPVLYQHYLEGLFSAPRYLPPMFRDLTGLYVWFGFASGMSLVDIGRVQQHFRQLFHRLPVADPIIAPVDIEID